MKKLYQFPKTNFKIIIAALAFFVFSQADAQVTFKPGLRAGANFSHFTKGDNVYANEGYYDFNGSFVPTYNDVGDFSSKTDIYVGFYGALKLTKYYTLQPEITYSNQGSKYRNPFGETKQLNISYLSVAVINKFTFNEQFNVHLGPTIDFVVDQNYDVENDVDLAFELGAGYNFTPNFGIEGRVKKGVINVVDFSGSDHTNVVFQAGLTYTFDVK